MGKRSNGKKPKSSEIKPNQANGQVKNGKKQVTNDKKQETNGKKQVTHDKTQVTNGKTQVTNGKITDGKNSQKRENDVSEDCVMKGVSKLGLSSVHNFGYRYFIRIFLGYFCDILVFKVTETTDRNDASTCQSMEMFLQIVMIAHLIISLLKLFGKSVKYEDAREWMTFFKCVTILNCVRILLFGEFHLIIILYVVDVIWNLYHCTKHCIGIL